MVKESEYFSKEDMQIVNKQNKRCLILLLHREIQIKITIRLFHSHHTDMPCFTALHFIDHYRYWFSSFTDWRFGQHCLKQVYQYHFSTSIFLFVSLCHILAILIKYLTFPLLHLLWASVIVIFNVIIVTILGHHESCTCETANNQSYVYSDCSTAWWLPSLSSSGLPIPWDIMILKLGQIITL